MQTTVGTEGDPEYYHFADYTKKQTLLIDEHTGLPRDNFDPTTPGRVVARRQFSRLFHACVRWVRFLLNILPAVLLWMWPAKREYGTPGRLFWFRQWWRRQGTVVKLALLLSLGLSTVVFWGFLRSEEVGTMYDLFGQPIENVWLPKLHAAPNYYPHWNQLAATDWEGLGSGYISCVIHERGDALMNVTLPTLQSVLARACPAAGEKKCRCLAAVHVGLGCNVVYLNRFDSSEMLTMFAPQLSESVGATVTAEITWMTGEKQRVKTSEKALISYILANGLFTRETFRREEASCIVAAMAYR